ncbi:MAG: PilZ domain-containing protein [Bdellovibrionales bacterium]|nr:PilZ domain-containing protein [Bdellovibrionales bacterium]
MNDALRKFISRAPRYSLRPDDNQILRYVRNSRLNRSFSTRFVNISETGLAFATERSSAPPMGEIIKIEFPIPGGESMAWFARVVRLEEKSLGPWWDKHHSQFHHAEIIVGVQFHELPDHQKLLIRTQLQKKFQQMLREQQLAKFISFKKFLANYGWKILFYLVCISLTVALLYYLSLPSANYDPKRGAPWGHRF